jgi:16S rRNA (uracil1498-N3)-methyltransferase
MPLPRFFVDASGSVGDIMIVEGSDALHISKSLRMKPGEGITLCDGRGTDYHCELVRAAGSIAEARVLSVTPTISEPEVEITLYASIIKGDKMDIVIQKSVELGVHSIVPVLSERCIYKYDKTSEKNKLSRWNKISLEASKQSGRGRIPQVLPFMTFERALQEGMKADMRIIAYENGTIPIGDMIESSTYRTSAVFIGPEGGYTQKEVLTAEGYGFTPITLGNRILRAETAPLCVLSIMIYAAERDSKKGRMSCEKEDEDIPV